VTKHDPAGEASSSTDAHQHSEAGRVEEHEIVNIEPETGSRADFTVECRRQHRRGGDVQFP
jgi:hypothetical protein